jgi:hypothetical protein
MPTPYERQYDGYNQQARQQQFNYGQAQGQGQYTTGQGQYPASSPYGQAQMPQAGYPMQQQAMVAPSVSNVQVQQQQNQWQNQQAANYNYLQQQQQQLQQQHQQFVVPPHPPNYSSPATQHRTVQYQHSSPLQQFAAGSLQESRQQNQQQQYWPQDPNYNASYQQPQPQPQRQPQPAHQPPSTHLNAHSYLPGQSDVRHSLQSSSPIIGHQANVDQTDYASVNRRRSQQHLSQASQLQQLQSTPISQAQQNANSRPSHITPASDQRLLQPQQYQRTPSQSMQTPNQQQTHPSQLANGPTQQTPSRQPTQTPRVTSQTVQTPSSTPNSRTLTYVEIPVHRPVDMAPKPKPQDRTVKRSSSDEGDTIVVSQSRKQQPHPVAKAYVQIPRYPQSSPLTDLVSSQVVPQKQSSGIDYQATLLSLSDEYVTAAHTMSARLCSPEATEEDLSQYHKLIATALGCLESLIANYRPHEARREARVRLRFANLLFEETEDTITTEEVLSKGISFCERNRLTDTKYAMHHLLVRVMYKTNPTAAIKTLEKLTQEVETMGLVSWIYALRFLRVSLSLQSAGSSDISAMLRHLAAMSEHADTHQHIGVQVAAATLDAMVHLQSGETAAVEMASRSLAAARTHQLDPVMDEIPQIRATMDLLDLSCAFMQSVPPEQTIQRINQFHQTLDAKVRATGWTADGSFSLPLGIQSNGDVEADTGGIFRRNSTGGIALSFMWFTRSQLYMVGYMLGGISMMPKNGEDRKTEAYLTEGIKLNRPTLDASAMSIKAVESQNDLQQHTAVTIKLLQIFAFLGRAAWKQASQAIEALRTGLERNPQYQDEYTTCAILYLSGVCKHAIGEEVAALALYQSPELLMQPSVHKTITPVKDLQALAGLNSVLILRFLPQDPRIAEKCLADLGPYCESNPNKGIQSAYHLLRAHDPDPSMTIIKVKQCIQEALRPAQAVKNVRIMAVIMNTMTEQFFHGIVGKQAMGSAVAAAQLGHRSQDPLWYSVGVGMKRDTLKRSGNMAAAAEAEQMARTMMNKLPAGVKSRLM